MLLSNVVQCAQMRALLDHPASGISLDMRYGITNAVKVERRECWQAEMIGEDVLKQPALGLEVISTCASADNLETGFSELVLNLAEPDIVKDNQTVSPHPRKFRSPVVDLWHQAIQTVLPTAPFDAKLDVVALTKEPMAN